jgi:hypothetical protein
MNKAVVQICALCWLFLSLIMHGKGKGKSQSITRHQGPRGGVEV